MADPIDSTNLGTMRTAAAVEQYTGPEYILPHERLAFDRVAPEVRGRSILDIGVGGGRTTRALLELSADYLGVDYSPEMVAASRRRFPGVRIEHADARDLRRIADDSIALAVFSCNGISMVGHEDRLAILREVRRVLVPGGYFIFTTYNRNSPQATAGYRAPDFRFSANPARLAVRSVRWTRDVLEGLRNRRRLVPLEIHQPEYAIINDFCHNYGVMLYYIGLSAQRRQLEAEGFAPDAPAYEVTGRLIEDDSRLDSMLFIARKR